MTPLLFILIAGFCGAIVVIGLLSANGAFDTPRVDFTHFTAAVAIVSLMQRLQLVYQVGTDDEFARKCFKAVTYKQQVEVMCKLIINPDIIIGFAEEKDLA